MSSFAASQRQNSPRLTETKRIHCPELDYSLSLHLYRTRNCPIYFLLERGGTMVITFIRRPFDLPFALLLYNYRHVDIDYASSGWGLSKRDQICEHPVPCVSSILFGHVHIRHVFRKPIHNAKNRSRYHQHVLFSRGFFLVNCSSVHSANTSPYSVQKELTFEVSRFRR